MKKPLIPSLWMLLAGFSFACMGVFVKLGVAVFGTAEAVFYRSLVALLVMQAFVSYKGLDLRTAHAKAHASRSLIGGLAMMIYFSTIAMVPLATAVTLNYIAPLFLAAILYFWFKEPAKPMSIALLVLGFVGVVLLVRPVFASEQWLGALCGLIAGFLFGVVGLNIRRLGELGEPEWRTVYYFSATCTAYGLLWTLYEGGFHSLDMHSVWLILGMGGFGVLAQVCMTSAFKNGKTLIVANLQYVTVVFASLFGILIWQEILPLSAWAGMFLIIGSNILMAVLGAKKPAKAIAK